MQLLFQLNITGDDLSDNLLEVFWEGNEEDHEVREFAYDIVQGTRAHLHEIDSVVQAAAEHWTLGRMAVVDRNILRAATYELLYRPDIPASVALNEAIEIAKKYSTVESAAFINGILDKIVKTREAQQGETP